VILSREPIRVPPRSGRSHIYRLLGALAGGEYAGRADLTRGLWGAARARSRRGLAVVVSDFHDEGRWEQSLRVLAHRHEVVAAVISDPRELHLPNVGVVRMEDIETGRQNWIDTASRQMRRRFASAARQRQDSIERRVVAAGAHLMSLSTDRDWIGDVVGWVLERRRHGSASGRSA
jgi:uncharacterized protein (DUF58 family)